MQMFIILPIYLSMNESMDSLSLPSILTQRWPTISRLGCAELEIVQIHL